MAMALAILIPLVSFGMKSPTILYGPDLRLAEILEEDSDEDADLIGIPFDSLDSYDITRPSIITVFEKRAFIMLCEGRLIEILPNSQIKVDPSQKLLEIIFGAVFAHLEEPPGELCYSLATNSSELRYHGTDSLYIQTEDTSGWLMAGGQFRKGSFILSADTWAMKQSKDARYIFREFDDGDIPDPNFKFKFPSVEGPVFSHSSRGKGGVATYRGETYYYAGGIYRARLWELVFAYDFWFAFSEKGKFYSEAWDEWSDLIDHIHYIQLFELNDPLYLRAGLLQNITYGTGLLVANYDNAVILPFEKKSGLQMCIRRPKFRADGFINDIGYPRVMGLHARVYPDDRLRVSATLVADFDMYSSIRDRDGDSYPDLADPETDNYNSPTDSIIMAEEPPSMKDIDRRVIVGSAVGGGYTIIKSKTFRTDISGELAMLSNMSSGVSAPDLTFRFGRVAIGGGMDFQTPGFFDGFIDGNYERDRGYLQEQEDGSYIITGRVKELDETEGWLYGWHNSFAIDYPDYVVLKTTFRDIYREDTRNKRLGIYLTNKYPWTPYVYSSDFFIEQKNVEHLFQKKTDGQQWGFSIQVRPHHTIRVNARYRERYDDENLDGEITSSEIERNFNGNVIIYGEYWLRKYIEWRREKRAEKHAEKAGQLSQ